MSRRIHILGICGTFMGGLALLARELGYQVSGSDANVYPPMSTQLAAAGIELMEGYDPSHLDANIDEVVVGNALSRGNPAVEFLLDRDLRYTSGPAWLAEHVLRDRWVLAVAGTHGKTTTSSMLAEILEHAGMSPGFLIGGVPAAFGVSARLGDTPFFVVEADEYDSAFFDKRSKFVHYRPRTLVINNLEFDHADIFADLAAIQRQFHHLVRTVPSSGLIIHREGESAVDEVLTMGCWSQTQAMATDPGSTAPWRADALSPGAESFILQTSTPTASVTVDWQLCGQHNLENALAAAAAAHHVGVRLDDIAGALDDFAGVKRRLECIGVVGGVSVYDDFAHHPTAIASTLKGLRAKVGHARILTLIEPRSRTMRMGGHREALAQSTSAADRVWWYEPEGMDWSLEDVAASSSVPASVCRSIDGIIEQVAAESAPGDMVVVMSNGGFGGIHENLLVALAGN